MSDLLDEIKEDIIKEKYALIWQKYGNYFIGAAILALIATAAGVAQKNHNLTKNQTYSDALYAANQASGEDAIKKYDALITGSNNSYKAIASIQKAAAMIDSKNNSQALALYEEITKSSATPQEFSDLAKLISLSVNSNLEAGLESSKNVVKLLHKATKDDAIFKYSAMEISALNEIKNNNITKAKDIFNTILQADEAPQDLKTRAREMLSDITIASVTENKNGQ